MSRDLARPRDQRLEWHGRSHSTLITILPRLVAIDTMVAEILWFQFATWSCKTMWSKGHVTLWAGAYQGKLPKSWTHCLSSPYWEIFRIRNTNLQFRSNRHGWQKNEKKKNKGNCKALCCLRKRKNTDTVQKLLFTNESKANYLPFHGRFPVKVNILNTSFCCLKIFLWSIPNFVRNLCKSIRFNSFVKVVKSKGLSPNFASNIKRNRMNWLTPILKLSENRVF